MSSKNSERAKGVAPVVQIQYAGDQALVVFTRVSNLARWATADAAGHCSGRPAAGARFTLPGGGQFAVPRHAGVATMTSVRKSIDNSSHCGTGPAGPGAYVRCHHPIHQSARCCSDCGTNWSPGHATLMLDTLVISGDFNQQ